MSQQKTQPRVWTVDLQRDEDGELLWDLLREDAQRTMIEVEAIGARIGGKFYLEPRRAEINGVWHTVGWTVAWDSFVPGKRPARPQAVEATSNAGSVEVLPVESLHDPAVDGELVLMQNGETGERSEIPVDAVEQAMAEGWFEVPVEVAAA